MAVEIIDRDLRVAARTALRAGERRPLSLDEGAYVARGWLPGGRFTETTFAVGAARSDPPDVVLETATAPSVTAPIRPYARWFAVWRRIHGRWEPDDGSAARPGEPVAVQFGTDDGPTVTTVVPRGWKIDGYRDGPEFGGDSFDNGALTLLQYLASGDIRSASTIMADYGDEPSTLPPDAIIAIGYLLFRTGDRRFPAWAAEAAEQLPWSPDAAVLSAWSHLQGPAASVARADREVRRAVELGLPVVADGVGLLADGLAAVGRAQPRRPVGFRLAAVRLHQRALLPGLLTSYFSVTPNNPVPAMRSIPAASSEGSLRALRLPGGASTEWAVIPAVPLPATAAGLKSGLSSWRFLVSRTRPRNPVAAFDAAAGFLVWTASPRRVAALRGTFLGIAQAGERMSVNDVLRAVTRQERAHVWVAPPRSRALPGIRLVGARAAGAAETARMTWSDPAAGLDVELQQTRPDTVEVTARLAADRPALVEVYIAGDRGWARYLIVAGTRIRLSGVDDRLDVALGEVRDPSTLADGDADTVSVSVEVADGPGRDAWRLVLDQREPGDAVAQAIVEGLS